jgi:cytoskeletal protein CcmA (bactofilin family)
MFGQKDNQTQERTSPMPNQNTDAAQNVSATRLLTVSGDYAKIEGTFEIADSLEVECEIGGELNVRGKLTIGQNGTVNANVRTVDAVIKGAYEGNMIATGNVEIAATGRVTGNITTDSLVISKGGFFNGNVSRIKEEDKKEGRGFLLDEDRKGKGSASTPSPAPVKAGVSESGSSKDDAGELERVVQSTRNV